ncbi:hypothetical protein [Mycobacterium uberis]|uniref:hypothetical protein n=1 Tax=Mycobacterium uberis TaxID=2162698 RepID=UPI001FB22037|nr:hypothetical protein [Mycobacterium uberis]
MTCPANTPDVLVAGEKLPRYKLFVVIAGFATPLVGVSTSSSAPTVLGGTNVVIVIGLASQDTLLSPPGASTAACWPVRRRRVDLPNGIVDLVGKLLSTLSDVVGINTRNHFGSLMSGCANFDGQVSGRIRPDEVTMERLAQDRDFNRAVAATQRRWRRTGASGCR